MQKIELELDNLCKEIERVKTDQEIESKNIIALKFHMISNIQSDVYSFLLQKND